MLKLAFITLGIIALAMFLLCIRIILVSGGQFSSKHIGQSKEMRKRGINCVQSMDAMERRDKPFKVSERTETINK